MTRFDTEVVPELEQPAPGTGPRVLLLESREVPLGGVRAMPVHRALPQRQLPLVGAWCFLDRFGPQGARMRVEPHPHIGLQTVTWPLRGEVHHRDSVGSDVMVRRGELNLMTSGAGISHSEYSVDAAGQLDMLQLWVALPESRRHGPPAFDQYVSLPTVTLDAVAGSPATAAVVMGELGGTASPAAVYTPIVGAEISIEAGSRVRVPLRPDWEYAVIGVSGEVRVITAPDEAIPVDRSHLLYLGTERSGIELAADADATLFLLGGEPFEDDIVMWWNFVGRSHDEIVEAREEWQAASPRFGSVVGHGPERIPAPPMPTVRLTKRRRRV